MKASSRAIDGQGEVLIYRMHNWPKAFDTGDRGWAKSSSENLSANCETGMMQRLAAAEFAGRDAKGPVVSHGIMGDVQIIQPNPPERLFIARTCKAARSASDDPWLAASLPQDDKMPLVYPRVIASVLIHVAGPEAGLKWYERAFPEALRVRLGEANFECLNVAGVQIACVHADAKVASGPAGSVVYWNMMAFDATLAHFLSIGASLYRGPMPIEDGLRMCQIQDPWGNCIGLVGP